MKTMTVGDFKANFSKVAEDVKNGEEITVTYGKNKEILGHFIPKRVEKQKKRILGVLEGKGKVIFKDDFKMTEEEFLGL
jgi:hypothetical protein